VVSAGSEDTPLDPDAVLVMREVGIDISGHETKAVNRFLGRRFNYVVMLCDREKERSCPIFPGAIWRLQWDLEDPSMSTHGRSGARPSGYLLLLAGSAFPPGQPGETAD
jgi:arsenate reductase